MSSPVPDNIEVKSEVEAGATPMHVAAIMEKPEVMMVLRAAGGDVDLRHGGFRRSVIHESCCWDPSGLCLKVLLTSKDTTPPHCVESDEEYKVS